MNDKMVAARNVLIFFLAMVMTMGVTFLLAGCNEDKATELAIKMAARRAGYYIALSDMENAKKGKEICIKVKAGEVPIVEFITWLSDFNDPLLAAEIGDIFALMGIDPTLPPVEIPFMDALLDGYIEGVTFAELAS